MAEEREKFRKWLRKEKAEDWEEGLTGSLSDYYWDADDKDDWATTGMIREAFEQRENMIKIKKREAARINFQRARAMKPILSELLKETRESLIEKLWQIEKALQKIQDKSMIHLVQRPLRGQNTREIARGIIKGRMQLTTPMEDTIQPNDLL